jgi:hypothetical protein
MYDLIHGAIATQRVRDLVDTGDDRRTVRRLKAARAQATAQAEAQRRPLPELNARGGRVAALLRLRPWVQ